MADLEHMSIDDVDQAVEAMDAWDDAVARSARRRGRE